MSGQPHPTVRRRARRGQGHELRDTILEAAERLLVELGDSSRVAIRDVAEAIGVTPPSVYLHFKDKSELMFAVAERQFSRLAAYERAALEGLSDPLVKLQALGRAYVRFGRENPEQYRLLLMQRPEGSPPEVDQGERLQDATAFDILLDTVTEAVEAGAIRPADPYVVACAAWALTHGLTSLLIAKPDFPWPDVDAMVDHALMTHIDGLRR